MIWVLLLVFFLLGLSFFSLFPKEFLLCDHGLDFWDRLMCEFNPKYIYIPNAICHFTFTTWAIGIFRHFCRFAFSGDAAEHVVDGASITLSSKGHSPVVTTTWYSRVYCSFPPEPPSYPVVTVKRFVVPWSVVIYLASTVGLGSIPTQLTIFLAESPNLSNI